MMEDALRAFKQRLLIENQKQNLISRQTADTEIDKHILDSLALQRFLSLDSETLVDIGSGAGFPGFILGLVSRETSVTLVESDQKKSRFLQETQQALQAKNIRVVRERAEALGQNPQFRGQFSLCTSRAVARIRVLLEYALPLLKVGGSLYLWKGPRYSEELSEAQSALALLGGTFEQVYAYSLCESETRYIVKIIKTSETPLKYPRKIGIPTKRPL